MADQIGAATLGSVRSGARPASRRGGSLARLSRRRSTIAIMLCLPLIIVLFGLKLYPTLFGIYLSMLNRQMTEFVGLANYAFLLGRNTFRMVIFQSCLFAISAVILKAVTGFVMAHLMHN